MYLCLLAWLCYTVLTYSFVIQPLVTLRKIHQGAGGLLFKCAQITVMLYFTGLYFPDNFLMML